MYQCYRLIHTTKPLSVNLSSGGKYLFEVNKISRLIEFKTTFQPKCLISTISRSKSLQPVLPGFPWAKRLHASQISNFYLMKYIDKYSNFCKLKSLKQNWDPKFNIVTFKEGAAQALCTSVNLIRISAWNDLRGLFTRNLLEKLQEDEHLFKEINKNPELSVANINELNIILVVLQEIVEYRYCDIDVKFDIEGWLSLTDIKTPSSFTIRLHRNYSNGQLPEWTITRFNYVL